MTEVSSVSRHGSRYCNPLTIPDYPVRAVSNRRKSDFRSLADPDVIRHEGTYYLFASGGLLWTSDDLLHWEHHSVTLPEDRRIGAPHVAAIGASFYLTGNDTGFYRAPHPLGPWEYFGDFHDSEGNLMLLFDPMVFVDDDERVYIYYSGRSTDGIYGVELDPENPVQFLGEPVHFFTFEPSHIWENGGDRNEHIRLGWIEAPWMTKRDGTYYLQYSGSGTDWQTYAVGVYTGDSPLGPFTYAPNNPILVHQHGLINGTGHHCIVEAPDGNVWMMYNVLYRNWNRFERRIGMDPVGFDESGGMYVVGPSETPQWAPGVQERPWESNDSGSTPISINKFDHWASSERPGFRIPFAFDNNVRTWWEPDPADPMPWIMIDMGCANPTDVKQEYMADSCRILFSDAYLDAAEGIVAGPYKYRVDVSLDGNNFQVALDRMDNAVDNNVDFAEFGPIRCRFVRLTITGSSRNVPAGIIEFTVFGQPV